MSHMVNEYISDLRIFLFISHLVTICTSMSISNITYLQDILQLEKHAL